MSHTWADSADRVLAKLFVLGQPAPSSKALRDAYPFGQRAYHPYKVWCRRVKAFRAAHAKGMAMAATHHRRDPHERDTETADMFASGGMARA